MLSTAHNFLFVHIPKTAGNAIQDNLRGYSDDVIVSLSPHQDGVERFEIRSPTYKTVKHSTLAEYEQEYGPEMLASLFKFTCVRNPWDRCMSHYFSPHRGDVAWDKHEFLEFVDTVVMPFAHYTSRGPLIETACKATKNVDFVIRYENLEADFAEVCRQLGLPQLRLAHRNKSPRTNLRKYYDADSIRRVATRFKDEASCFGYSYNP